MSNMLDVVHLGDCLDILPSIPDASVDCVITDPPYGLDSREPTKEVILQYIQGSALAPLKQGRQHCANRFTGVTRVPDANNPESQIAQDAVTFRVLFSALRVSHDGVQLQDQSFRGKQEVHAEGSVIGFDHMLMGESDPQFGELSNDSKLCLRERQAFPGCVEVCRCFTQTSPTTFRVLVRLGDNASRDTQCSTGIVAAGATEVCAILTLDAGGRTGYLSPTNSTDDIDAGLLLAAPEDVGASSPASRLLTFLQEFLRSKVAPTADRAISFDVSVPTALFVRFHSPYIAQKDFMGKQWDIPSVTVWEQCYRVLKPGGHLLSFGGTRTWDLISVGLRAAGFTSRDTIAEFFGGSFAWIQGQGFPKSQDFYKNGIVPDVEEQLKKQGISEIKWRKPVEGEVPTRKFPVTLAELGFVIGGHEDGTFEMPPELARWDGYGTALKPSWEPILVFRKPFDLTLADNAIVHGTGGLNIDATRVQHSNAADFAKHKDMVDRLKEKGGSMSDSWKNSSDLSGASDVKTAGRWPPNLILVHHPDCKRVGTTEAPAPVINRFDDGMKPFGEGAGHPYTSSGGGTEEVAVYECVEGCPVRMLNEQSGDCKSGEVKQGVDLKGFWGQSRNGTAREYKASSGGASRFFPSFEGQEIPNAPFFYTGKANKKETTLDGRVPNNHPTKKPLALMEWLVKLVCPKGGTVLDPYCGSGATLVAATTHDMRFIGIERDPEYHAIASKRVGIVAEREGGIRAQQNLVENMDAILAELGIE